MGVRINSLVSNLHAELLDILALKFINTPNTNTLTVNDLLSSLAALHSHHHDRTKLVSEARHPLFYTIMEKVEVILVQIPSHVHLHMHNKPDKLTEACTLKEGPTMF